MLLGPTPIETAAALSAISISNDAKELLKSATMPADFLQLLIARERFADAMRVFPYIVGVRQSVWWACLCSWHGVNRAPAPGEDEAFAAVVQWLQAPSEPHYEVAVAIASKDVVATPVEYCTRAISWAGYMKSPEGPWQAIDPLAAATTALASSFLAMHHAGKNGVPADEKQLLKMGLAVADGNAAWDNDLMKGAST